LVDSVVPSLTAGINEAEGSARTGPKSLMKTGEGHAFSVPWRCR
jgi:hypothetical protein